MAVEESHVGDEPSPTLGVLRDAELRDMSERFGVAEEQARRDRRGPVFSPDLVSTRHPEPSVMSVNETRVQLQLLSRTGYSVWPTEYRNID